MRISLTEQDGGKATLVLPDRATAKKFTIDANGLGKLNALTDLKFSTAGDNGHIERDGDSFVFSPQVQTIKLSKVNEVNPNARFIIFGTIAPGSKLTSLVITEYQYDGHFNVADSFTETPDSVNLDDLQIIAILAEGTPMPLTSTGRTQEHLAAMKAAEIIHGKYNLFLETFDWMCQEAAPQNSRETLQTGVREVDKTYLRKATPTPQTLLREKDYLQSVEIPPEEYAPGIRDKIITYCMNNPDEDTSRDLGLNKSLIDDDVFNRLRCELINGGYQINSPFSVSIARNKAFLNHPDVDIVLESVERNPTSAFSVEFLLQREELTKLKSLDIEEARALNIDPANIRLRIEILEEGFKEENHNNDVFYELGKKRNLLKPGTVRDAFKKAKEFPNCTLSKGLGSNPDITGKLLNRLDKRLLLEWAETNSETEFGKGLIELLSTVSVPKVSVPKVSVPKVSAPKVSVPAASDQKESEVSSPALLEDSPETPETRETSPEGERRASLLSEVKVCLTSDRRISSTGGLNLFTSDERISVIELAKAAEAENAAAFQLGRTYEIRETSRGVFDIDLYLWALENLDHNLSRGLLQIGSVKTEKPCSVQMKRDALEGLKIATSERELDVTQQARYTVILSSMEADLERSAKQSVQRTKERLPKVKTAEVARRSRRLTPLEILAGVGINRSTIVPG
jgi:hypothetical protein